MTFRNAFLTGAMASTCLLTACGGSEQPLQTPQIASTFTTSVDGWSGGYADYTAATEPSDVVWEMRALPAPLSGNAYYTGGTNRSDDLFIYSKKKYSGYLPSKQYKLSFEIAIATNQSSGCFGVGGSPGESVYVVAGAAPTEPKTVLTAGEYTVNLDRGNQATPGNASQVLGNVANSVQNCGAQVYQTKIVKSAAPLMVHSDAHGDIWVFFGIDSGFEAKSTVFYKSFKAEVDLAQ
jgi:hypothetical protein